VFAEGALWGAAQAAGLPVAAGLPHHRTQSPECAGHLAVHQLQLRPVSSVAAAAAAHAAAVDTHPVTGHPIIPIIPETLASIHPTIQRSICPSIQPHTYTHHHQKSPPSAPTANKNQPRAKPPNHPPDKGHRKADLKDTSSQETCPKKKIT